MRHEFTVLGRLAGMNEITEANRRNRYIGAKQKRENQNRVCDAIRASNAPTFEKPVSGTVLIVRNNRRSDRDNISAGAVKVILDALQETGVIRKDNWSNCLEFPCKCVFGKDEKVIVTITDEERVIDRIPYWSQADSDEWRFGN